MSEGNWTPGTGPGGSGSTGNWTRGTGPCGDPCYEQWEPDARPHDTHTCDRRAGQLPHHCPLCGSTWSTPGGLVTAPSATEATT